MTLTALTLALLVAGAGVGMGVATSTPAPSPYYPHSNGTHGRCQAVCTAACSSMKKEYLEVGTCFPKFTQKSLEDSCANAACAKVVPDACKSGCACDFTPMAAPGPDQWKCEHHQFAGLPTPSPGAATSTPAPSPYYPHSNGTHGNSPGSAPAPSYPHSNGTHGNSPGAAPHHNPSPGAAPHHGTPAPAPSHSTSACMPKAKCCRAKTLPCMAACAGLAVKSYCRSTPQRSNSTVCKPVPLPRPPTGVCCKAQVATCLACEKKMSVNQYCADTFRQNQEPLPVRHSIIHIFVSNCSG